MARDKVGKPYKLGSYGSGTLWCHSGPNGLSIFFNDTRIATRRRAGRREVLPCISFDPAWRVTTVEGTGVWVQHNGGEGVFISLSGGMR
jgi:hypothetical protein